MSNDPAERVYGINPRTGETLQPGYPVTDPAAVDGLVAAAVAAFDQYRLTDGVQRARLLRRIADHIVALGDELITVCDAETALGAARITSERGRTVGQLQMFADLVSEGSWVDARIDRAQPQRRPLPKPDLRRMLQAIGPVLVFGASNFPLAFSVAGGDSASALAAGNPVIVKAHGSHPGTSALVARAIAAALADCGLPQGVFTLVHGAGAVIGTALARHPGVCAVGFTGSHHAGRALMDAAAARIVPIPVYAEMGSVNPFMVLPAALTGRGAEIARNLSGSVCLGVGQFCTNPGLILTLENERSDGETFLHALAGGMTAAGPGVMLNAGIADAYRRATAAVGAVAGVRTVIGGVAAAADPGADAAPTTVGPCLFAVDAERFAAESVLWQEMFGPATLVVRCSHSDQLRQCLAVLRGNLTATIHGEPQDHRLYHDLIRSVEKTVGRVIYDGYPTGVEVCAAMNHGGPYPAAASAFHTSVGTAAILRFARPVAYQNAPGALLPAELRDENLLGIQRLVDGRYTRSSLAALGEPGAG